MAVARERSDSPKGARDLALIRLLHDLALRRAEAVGLDLCDVDLGSGTVSVFGKCKTDKARLTLPRPTRAALAGWLAHRGEHSGPLFVPPDPGSTGRSD